MVAVIVNARWPWITDQLEGTPLDGNAFIGQYTDIDSTWYQVRHIKSKLAHVQ